jgi:hypothetical protein
MANFRVYYVERTVRDPRAFRGSLGRAFGEPDEEARVPQGDETEWEEDIEAENARDALRLFFQDHLGASGDLGYIDEEGRTQRPFRIDDYDLNRTYVWTEGDKFMEYQGIEQIDADLVICPLCGGSGQVLREVAEQFEQDEEEFEQ